MLHLMESARLPRTHRPAWMAASGVVHAALISAATLAGTRETVHNAIQPTPDRIIYTAPSPAPKTASPAPQHHGSAAVPAIVPLRVPSIAVPTFRQAIDVAIPPAASPGLFTAPVAIGAGTQPTTLVARGAVFHAHDVDRAAMPHAGNSQPEYPALLRTAGVGGEVLVRFVVDTTGRVEPASIAIVDATHSLFADAVRRWLRRTRYAPAEAAGIRVRQLVEQRIDFTLR